MILGTYRKQPRDERDVDIDCADWLAELGGDTLFSAVAEVDDPSLTVDSPVVLPSTVKVWVRGGTSGAFYKVTVVVETTGGRIKEAEFRVRVRDD